MSQCGMCRYNNCPFPFGCECKCHDGEVDAEQAAYEHGRADERAKIVAWLKGLPWDEWHTTKIADAISRGKHEPK